MDDFDVRMLKERRRIVSAIVRAADNPVAVIGALQGAESEPDARDRIRALLDVDDECAVAVLDIQFRRVMPRELRRLRDELSEIELSIEGSD